MSDPVQISAGGSDEAALLVSHIAEHQRALGLSDVAFVKRYPALGSARTWRTRLVAGAWGELRLDVWVPTLRRVLDGIEAEPPPPAPRAVDPLDRSLERVAGFLVEARALSGEGDFPGALSSLAIARGVLRRAERLVKGGVL